MLAIYEALVPYHTLSKMLAALAQELNERWQAPESARPVHEAAEVYRLQGLI